MAEGHGGRRTEKHGGRRTEGMMEGKRDDGRTWRKGKGMGKGAKEMHEQGSLTGNMTQ